MKIRFAALAASLVLSGCYSQAQVASHWLKKSANKASGNCVSEGHLKVGSPYKIKGVQYTPVKSSLGYDETGIASWYGSDFHGKASANGECYDMYAMTAAHKTLPLPTTVRVTNLKNGRSVILKVNDRGPYAKGRIIDLSYAAAKKLDLAEAGVGKVRVQAIGGPHHKRGGASQSAISASRKASPSQRKKITAQTSVGKTQNNYGLADRALDSVSARFNRTKNVNIGGVDVNANINESVSLRDIKQILPKRPTPAAQPRSSGSFTDRISNRAKIDTSSSEPVRAPEPKAADGLAAPVFYSEPLKATPQTTPAVADKAATPLAAGISGMKIQFGSFNNHSNAMALWEKSMGTFPDTMLETQSVNGTPIHRVRLGPFKNKADAAIALDKARGAGFNNAVIVVE